MSTPQPVVSIGRATRKDVGRIHSFLFRAPDQHIRRRTVEEVRELTRKGQFYLARRGKDIVGACYVEGPDGDGVWELGGAYTDPGFRRKGIFKWLGLAMILQLFALNASITNLRCHVLSRNRHPLTVLKELGFQKVASDVAYKKKDFFEMEHMEADEQGNVYIDIYELRVEHLPALLADFNRFQGHLPGLGDIRFDLPLFTDEKALDAIGRSWRFRFQK